MMKNFTLIAFFTLLMSQANFAQIGAVAPDFMITDIEGVEHNLYQILDDGKVVVIDVSATWCPPCWSMHEEHYMKDIYDQFGPNGTDQVHVIFYEGDAGTTLADLEGNTNGTLGDWLEGTDYPVVNESPLSLDLNIYAPLGFPTVNVISPNDKKIKADLYDNWFDGSGLPAMIDIIESHFPVSTSVSNVDDINVSVFPNPMTEVLNIDLSGYEGELTKVRMIDIKGQVVNNTVVSPSAQKITLDVAAIPTGMYVVELFDAEGVVGTKRVVKD